jgi:hypothetical protein
VSGSGAEPAKRRVRRSRVQRRRAAEDHRAETHGRRRGPSIAPRRSGLVRCPRRSSAPQAGRIWAAAGCAFGAGPAERVQRRSPLRSLPAVGRHLETFPHVHYGRSGTGALARTVVGTRGPATWDQAGGAVLSFRIWRWRRQRQRRSVLSRGNSVRSERNHAVQNQPQDRSRFARKHRGAGFDGVTVTLITPRRNDRGRMASTTPRQRKTTGRVMHESRADPEREHVHPSPA